MAKVEHGGRTGSVLAAGATGTATSRLAAVRLGMWLLAALLAARQVAAVLRTPRGDRLTDPETWVGAGGVLHLNGSLYDSTRFTGTPFGGLVLTPLVRSAEQALGWAWTFGTLLLVVALGLVAARALPQPVSRRTSLLAAPVAISLLMLSLPVRDTIHLGQTSIIPVLLVLLGCLVARGERRSGVLIGVGAALQPTLLLFAPLPWFTGRRRAAASTAVTFALCTALAWAAMPHDSYTYWAHHPVGVGLGGKADDHANQSLHGALLRLGLTGPLEIGLFLVLGAAVAAVGLRRAVRYARDGQPLLAVAVTGCVAVAVSPTTWQHQLLWVLPAVVGRVGGRTSDRYVWPLAVVLVMTLPAKTLIPNTAALHPLRDNVILLAALAAACAVPFLERASPAYRSPRPAVYAPPVPARPSRVPSARLWRRVLSRPNLLFELLLIRLCYAAYSWVRLTATGSRATAEAHGHEIHAIEKALSIDVEHWANRTVVTVPRLEHFLGFYYESFHFVVPLAVLGVLYARRPADYRWARTSLGFATLLGLLGFWLYPLAPPRLMPGFGFIDTVHGVQDFARPDYGVMTAVTNQYAAMPSLHFGWSLWCGVVIAALAPRRRVKALGLLHPLCTVSAIVATANHWVLDAAGGAAVVGAGFALTRLLSGPRAVLAPCRESEHGPVAGRPRGDGCARAPGLPGQWHRPDTSRPTGGLSAQPGPTCARGTTSASREDIIGPNGST
ncbi:bifunctional glycosyltransferase 87/phosphatase PAP2 family protein [Streptomyces sp. NPDC007264]|uniref:bifunctional glycosyltransferase 87/phosphatase PAP2 family protein n=1 Tax=Streptomyces sp. NPDC007264 TaxID=3364777 RepID=UPI0036D90025